MRETKLTELPKIGDQLIHVPTFNRVGIGDLETPMPCTVVYVNEAHCYYTVQFKETGIKESYKLGTDDY